MIRWCRLKILRLLGDDQQTSERMSAFLKSACDRDWKDETPIQVAVIAANAMRWRKTKIDGLKVIVFQNRAEPLWTQTPPTEQGEYWHWNGDRDSAPLPTFVMYSGFSGTCFVSRGQLGLPHAIDCDQYGGWWKRLVAPPLPDDSVSGVPVPTRQGEQGAGNETKESGK